MRRYFFKLVSSISYTLNMIYDPNSFDFRRANLTTGFLWNQLCSLSKLLFWPLFFLTVYFQCSTFLNEKKTFSNLKIEKRIIVWKSWKNSSWGFKKDFVKFYENLALLAFHSYPNIPPLAEKKENLLV